MFNLSKRPKVQKLVFLIGVAQILIGMSYLAHAYYVKFTWPYDVALYDWDDVGGNDGVFWTFWGILVLLYSFLQVEKFRLPTIFVLLPSLLWGILSALILGSIALEIFSGRFEPNIFWFFILLHAALLLPCILVLVFLWKSS
ncbi:hypothetical protein [Thermococcus sp. MV5]|uniref:hypothetical protein n=1 Tax=Thermococcus sp. MV5 TaxID=1638272 RepID=UPI00143BBE4D|nr:hypothetical protein [Thermococcus sp. MV5]